MALAVAQWQGERKDDQSIEVRGAFLFLFTSVKRRHLLVKADKFAFFSSSAREIKDLFFFLLTLAIVM